MSLNHKTVEIQVHGLLGERHHKFALTRYVTRVTNEWQLWQTAMELKRQLPLRSITEIFLAV